MDREAVTISSYRDLLVWQKAMDLIVLCYEVTAVLPKTETYGLSSQLRRAAVSVAANIAEGNGRSGTREYLHSLSIGNGSLMETETLLLIARRLTFTTESQTAPLLALSAEIGRMMNGLIRALNRKLETTTP